MYANRTHRSHSLGTLFKDYAKLSTLVRLSTAPTAACCLTEVEERLGTGDTSSSATRELKGIYNLCRAPQRDCRPLPLLSPLGLPRKDRQDGYDRIRFHR